MKTRNGTGDGKRPVRSFPLPFRNSGPAGPIIFLRRSLKEFFELFEKCSKLIYNLHFHEVLHQAVDAQTKKVSSELVKNTRNNRYVVIVTLRTKGEKADFCTLEVRRITKKYKELARSTEKYKEVQRSTKEVRFIASIFINKQSKNVLLLRNVKNFIPNNRTKMF